MAKRILTLRNGRVPTIRVALFDSSPTELSWLFRSDAALRNEDVSELRIEGLSTSFSLNHHLNQTLM